MKYICSLFVVDDIEIAKEFYTKVLGLKITNDMGENIMFEGYFSLHEREHFKDLIDNLEIKEKTNNSELYFEEDDLDELQKRLIDEGVEFVHKISEQPWRQRVLRIYDPSYNIIEIGESLEFTAYRLWKEGLYEEEIAELLGISEEHVKEAVNQYRKEKLD